jgi:diguanylate cyclase (GGDEF)-like protein
MTIDPSTLTLAGGIAGFASGVFLLMYWLQDRTAVAALWWGVANGVLGLGVVLLGLEDVAPAFSRALSPILLTVSAATTWLAARAFNRGSPGSPLFSWLVLMSAAALAATGLQNQEQPRMGLAVAASAACYAVAATEFWRNRTESLQGRWSITALLGFQSFALILLAAEISLSPQVRAVPPIGWFGMIHFVGLVYAIGTGVLLTAMLRQRNELRHKNASLTDPLTELWNRRAFTEFAEHTLKLRRKNSPPVSLLLFDLDRFKSINDRFGHSSGDAVIQLFAETLTNNLRKTDAVGRWGGEEFVVLLPDCDAQTALGKASRVRSAFQTRARYLGGKQIDATVSAGVGTFHERTLTLPQMMASADAALYQAKGSGRNRVVPAGPRRDGEEPDNVVRIA